MFFQLKTSFENPKLSHFDNVEDFLIMDSCLLQTEFLLLIRYLKSFMKKCIYVFSVTNVRNAKYFCIIMYKEHFFMYMVGRNSNHGQVTN